MEATTRMDKSFLPRSHSHSRSRFFQKTVCAGLLFLGGVLITAEAQPTTTDATKGKSSGKTGDVELVERLLAARREYQLTLEALRQHYVTAGDIERARWAEDELKQFHMMNKQAYRLELDVPPPTLQAAVNIPEANKLFVDAMSYKDKGFGSDYVANQRRAELLLQKLLTNHPQSDKISDAAFQLGDIYESKAFHHYGRAAAYYERCFQWNPKTQYDARLRAAHLYDKQLNERSRAIELYKEITTHETDAKRIAEAQKRLAELREGK
jgi:tetratricopeptide (TPR) repeat protein